MLLASKSLLHVDTKSQESVFHLYLTLNKTMSQGITVAANPE